MSFSSLLSKLFGNKSQRDLKEIQPIVDSIKALMPKMQAMSNDELRQAISDVRADIKAAIKADEDAMAENRIKVEELPFEERQPLWDEIDKHEKNILDTIEDPGTGQRHGRGLQRGAETRPRGPEGLAVREQR